MIYNILMSLQFCVKLLSKPHRPAQHTSTTMAATSVPKKFKISINVAILEAAINRKESPSVLWAANMELARHGLSFWFWWVLNKTNFCVYWLELLSNYALVKNCDFLKLKKNLFKLTYILVIQGTIQTGPKQLFVFCHSRSHGCPPRGVWLRLTIY